MKQDLPPIPSGRRAGLPLLLAFAFAFAGCATGVLDRHDETLVEVASGRVVGRAELVERLRTADFVLLGEMHDAAEHHAARGRLLQALAAAPGTHAAVLAEQLTAGRQVAPQGELLGRLEGAGFAPKNWGWPLHRPLFEAVTAAGLPLAGANAPDAQVRAVAREGEAAVPPALAALLRAAPLDAQAQASLDADLREGHCGRLPAARLPAMRWAQRTRDAAMAQSLLQAADAGARPAVLVAGNGHVRTDWGVPRLLAALRPAAKIVSVGFAEPGAEVRGAPYDLLWIAARAPERDDPCKAFDVPPAKASGAAAGS